MAKETLMVCYTGEDPPAWVSRRPEATEVQFTPMFPPSAPRTETEAAARVGSLRPHVYVMNWPWDPYLSETIGRADDRLGLVCYLAPSLAIEDYESDMDVGYLVQRGITLASTPGCTTISVAEGTLALLLAVNVRLLPPDLELPSPWTSGRRNTLYGSTLGIVGMGEIGQRVARLAVAMGMGIRYYSRSRHWNVEEELGATYCDLPSLFGACDHVSLHPTSALTRGLVDREALSRARGITLVNTASERIVASDALREALQQGWVRIAVLDGLNGRARIAAWNTPYQPPHDYLVVPINTWETEHTRNREWEMCLEIIEAFKHGRRVPHQLHHGGIRYDGT